MLACYTKKLNTVKILHLLNISILSAASMVLNIN